MKYLVELPNLFEKIKFILDNDSYDIRKEAMWILCNIMQSGCNVARTKVFENNCFNSMNNYIESCNFEPKAAFSVYLEGVN